MAGGGSLALHGREWGNPNGPAILLIHGWSQALQCWAHQLQGRLAQGFRLVAFDLRGHGASEKPLAAEHYLDGRLWAEDVAAVIAARRLVRPILVGWSYGGLVIADYLAACGAGAIAGVNFVAAAVRLDEAAFGRLIGPGFTEPFPDATSPDLERNIDGIRRFVSACLHTKVPREDYERCLCWSMATPPAVRHALGARELDFTAVLGALEAPVLVTQGAQDRIVLPAMAERIMQCVPGARLSTYEEVGHLPFLEAAERFNAELADFAAAAAGA